MCCTFLLQQRHPLGVYVPGAAYDAVQVYAAPTRAVPLSPLPPSKKHGAMISERIPSEMADWLPYLMYRSKFHTGMEITTIF